MSLWFCGLRQCIKSRDQTKILYRILAIVLYMKLMRLLKRLTASIFLLHLLNWIFRFDLTWTYSRFFRSYIYYLYYSYLDWLCINTLVFFDTEETAIQQTHIFLLYRYCQHTKKGIFYQSSKICSIVRITKDIHLCNTSRAFLMYDIWLIFLNYSNCNTVHRTI